MGLGKLGFRLTLVLGVGLLCSCTSGPCRGKRLSEKTVMIFKPDGSKQCQKNTGVGLKEMAKQLGSIKVKSQAKKRDGKMRAAVCGADTGQINVYEIAEKDFPLAKNVGFAKWGRQKTK